MSVNLIEWSSKISQAEKTRQGIAPLTEQIDSLSLKDAYSIQLEQVHRKVNEGDHITGKKIGLTSLAMQQLLKVDEPDYGHLLESMAITNNVLDCSECIKPKMRTNHQRLWVTVTDTTDTAVAVKTQQIIFKFCTEWSIFNRVDLTLKTIFSVMNNHTTTSCSKM